LFLQHEDHESETFLEVGVVNGSEMHAFPDEPDIGRVVVAHDNEWIAMYYGDPAVLLEREKDLAHSKYVILGERDASSHVER
jgi:hypothetical protein